MREAGSVRFPASGSRPYFAWNNGLCAAIATGSVLQQVSSQFTIVGRKQKAGLGHS